MPDWLPRRATGDCALLTTVTTSTTLGLEVLGAAEGLDAARRAIISTRRSYTRRRPSRCSAGLRLHSRTPVVFR